MYHADPGSFSGTAEAAYYRRAVQNSVELPANISSCADYITGTIMGQPVVIITSGKVMVMQLHACHRARPVCCPNKLRNDLMLLADCSFMR